MRTTEHLVVALDKLAETCCNFLIKGKLQSEAKGLGPKICYDLAIDD